MHIPACRKDRINVAYQRLGTLKTFWSSGELTMRTKIDLLVACVFCRLLCAAETWTIKGADSRKLLAFEMRCYMRIFTVCWKDKMSNSIVRDRVRRHCTIVDVVKQRNLQLYGHICRMNDQRLVKIVMLEMVKGDRPRGRPARRLSDDITDWCGCSLPEAVQMASKREKWRGVIGLNGPPGSRVLKKKQSLYSIIIMITQSYLL